MARRASSSTNPKWILVVLVIAVLGAVGGRLLFRKVSDPYRTIPTIETDLYLENSNSLRGNIYKVRGTILNNLAWSPIAGRLFSLETDDAPKAILPVLVPVQFNHINVQKGQRFQFEIEVDDKGILTVRNLAKS